MSDGGPYPYDIRGSSDWLSGVREDCRLMVLRIPVSLGFLVRHHTYIVPSLQTFRIRRMSTTTIAVLDDAELQDGQMYGAPSTDMLRSSS